MGPWLVTGGALADKGLADLLRASVVFDSGRGFLPADLVVLFSAPKGKFVPALW
jgi:hypothetical protein